MKIKQRSYIVIGAILMAAGIIGSYLVGQNYWILILIGSGVFGSGFTMKQPQTKLGLALLWSTVAIAILAMIALAFFSNSPK